ncbi:hypothetical protein ACH5RR_008791 [Cinchona calisaya]|uniref:Uncharacterized protein n=1 Tax=Cinchona calisaya TaxID=153742 RepID=A0ABD3ACK8_9GENT
MLCINLTRSEWWDHNRASRKKNSKKTPTIAIAEANTCDDAAENGLVLVETTDICVEHLRSSSKKSISAANFNGVSIIREASLSLTNTFNLDSVLVVPSVDYNILSISQITKALSCVGEYRKGIQTLDYEILTCDYDQIDDKIDIEKGEVHGMTLDLGSYSKVAEVIEPYDASLTTPHKSSTKDVSILEPELPRK